MYQSQTVLFKKTTQVYYSSILEQSKDIKGRSNDPKSDLIQQNWRAELGKIKVLLNHPNFPLHVLFKAYLESLLVIRLLNFHFENLTNVMKLVVGV